MSEHAVYTKVEAVPVHMGAPVWPPRRARLVETVTTVPRFDAVPDWSFRSIRKRPAARIAGTLLATSALDATGMAPAETTPWSRAEPAPIPGFDDLQPAHRRPPGLSADAIYSGHFGFRERPFTLVPDPDFLFWSPAHKHAYAALEFGVMTGAPITMVTGEIGAGKTTLIQQLLHSLGEDIRIGLVSNTHANPDEMLRWAMMALGQTAPAGAQYPELVSVFQTFLISEYAAGRRVVLIFDEAQNLNAEALEELRMLTNINSGKDELLQLVLVGQPELRDRVTSPSMSQLAQRIVATYHLGALDAAATRAYIAHRLQTTGQTVNIFSQAASDLIFEATGGIPRRINQLCDLALVYAYSADQHKVVRLTVQHVLDDGVFFDARCPEGDLVLQ